MPLIIDFHLHSKYSRATSAQMIPEIISQTAKIKGIDIVGTGDFTHPLWLNELKNKLVETENGLYQLKENQDRNSPRFIVSGEISNIYSRAGQTRRVHNLIILPSLQSAEKISHRLSLEGNLLSDGRPMLGLDSEELLKIVLEIEPKAMFIPAHIWTPWYSVFGSMSGFNSLEEAFGQNTKYLAALETGLSSDPAMNWRLSALDPFSLVSNSDAHSPEHLGREVNVLEVAFDYDDLFNVIKNKDKNRFLYTIEFYPEEGKYHYDGHRLCGVCFSPAETKKHQGLCPVCGRPLTIGVLSRVEALADRNSGEIPANAIPFKKLVPLKEILAEVLETKPASKKVSELYHKLIDYFGSEFKVLLEAQSNDLERIGGERLAEALSRVREGKLTIRPGYDGEYGQIKIFNGESNNQNQGVLF